MLITLEGVDGSGKSTLHEALKEPLADLDPVFTREPGATWVGDQVRRAVAEQIDPVTEATLFVADHAAHLAKVVRPALAQGRLVISDRYSDSRYAYQSVTLRGIIPDPERWLRAMHNGWTVVPDRTFLCVLPVDAALDRLRPDRQREHFEQRAVLEEVQNNYLSFAKAEPARFVIVDAMQPPQTVVKFVAEAIREEWSADKKKRKSRKNYFGFVEILCIILTLLGACWHAPAAVASPDCDCSTVPVRDLRDISQLGKAEASQCAPASYGGRVGARGAIIR